MSIHIKLLRLDSDENDILSMSTLTRTTLNVVRLGGRIPSNQPGFKHVNVSFFNEVKVHNGSSNITSSKNKYVSCVAAGEILTELLKPTPPPIVKERRLIKWLKSAR
jgi:hypothetical protein